jgi:hypothetical protein
MSIVKKIKVCGKSGGFLLTSGGAMDDAKPENVRALAESVKKYLPGSCQRYDLITH